MDIGRHCDRFPCRRQTGCFSPCCLTNSVKTDEQPTGLPPPTTAPITTEQIDRAGEEIGSHLQVLGKKGSPFLGSWIGSELFRGDASLAWARRCAVRETMIAVVQAPSPDALPNIRSAIEQGQTGGYGRKRADARGNFSWSDTP